MKERLLGSQRSDAMAMESFSERDNLLEHGSRPTSNQVGSAKLVGSVVKVRASSFDTPESVRIVQVIFHFFIPFIKRKN